MGATLLLVDPAPVTVRALGAVLRQRKVMVRAVSTSEEALSELDFAPADLIVASIEPGVAPEPAIAHCTTAMPDLRVVALADHDYQLQEHDSSWETQKAIGRATKHPAPTSVPPRDA